MEFVRTRDGSRIPEMGLGVFQVPAENKVLEKTVRHALDLGFRLFDTADYYGNQRELARCLRESGLPREEYLLTTKLFPDDIKTGNSRYALERILKELDLGYVDIMLIHWPCRGMEKAWEEILRMKENGDIRIAGVSNFRIAHLEIIKQAGLPAPQIDQVEFHPLKQYRTLQNYCKNEKIQLEAYGPFMQGALLSEPQIIRLAEKYGRTPAQIILCWIRQKNVISIPKTVHRERMMENLDSFRFELAEEDIQALDRMNREQGSLPEPYQIYEESFSAPEGTSGGMETN